jgi:hypothetical protein
MGVVPKVPLETAEPGLERAFQDMAGALAAGPGACGFGAGFVIF